MINAALNLVRNNPDPLAFVVAGVMLIAYEVGAFVVTEDLLLGAFMVAAAMRSMMQRRSLSAPVAVEVDECTSCDGNGCASCDDAEG